jgi:hypothetical protein
MVPPAVKGAENRLLPLGVGLEKTPRSPKVVPPAGSWFRMEAGTVKVPGPAVVMQTNSAKLFDVPELPKISTVSVEPPPVHFNVSPALRVTVVGSPPVMVSRDPRVREVVNGPTSLPPAPFSV